MRAFALLFGLLFLTACSSPTITARSFYTSRKDLASYVLDTPDPEKSTMGLGQTVWVRWMVPTVEEGLVIDATLRFKDGSEKTSIYPIDSKWGWLMIEVSSEERTQRGDLLSYKILLRHNDEILASTLHKLWVEKVEIKDV